MEISNIIKELEEIDIPLKLYKIFEEDDFDKIEDELENQKKGDIYSIKELLKKILDNSSNTVCKSVTNTSKLKLLGSGALNEVFDIGDNFVLRQTKKEVNMDDFKIKTIKTENDKERYILSDSLYDIVINSIISNNIKNDPNFNYYVGSFYCSQTKKIYSIIEKNNTSLLSFFRNNFHLLSKELLFNFLFQYSNICHKLYKINVIDFDRHLDNIMIRYVNDSYIKKLIKKASDQKIEKIFDKEINFYDNNGTISPNPFVFKSEYNNSNIKYKIINRSYSIENYGMYVVPVDFGISIYKGKKDIYNEVKEYSVSTGKNVCVSASSTMTYYENIKAKYAIVNEEIHENVMFFFFLKNFVKNLKNVKNYINNQYNGGRNKIEKKIYEDINHVIDKINEMFKFCQDKRINVMNENEFRDDSIYQPEFYLYRNIGIPDLSIYEIIEIVYQNCPKNIKVPETIKPEEIKEKIKKFKGEIDIVPEDYKEFKKSKKKLLKSKKK